MQCKRLPSMETWNYTQTQLWSELKLQPMPFMLDTKDHKVQLAKILLPKLVSDQQTQYLRIKMIQQAKNVQNWKELIFELVGVADFPPGSFVLLAAQPCQLVGDNNVKLSSSLNDQLALLRGDIVCNFSTVSPEKLHRTSWIKKIKHATYPSPVQY